MSDERRTEDAGLGAVERVRGVREKDSRIGLQRALAATREREAAEEAARMRLAAHPPFVSGSAQAFRADRAVLTVLAEHQRRQQELTETSRTVAEEARGRWQYDRGRLRAVELLLERRREERAAERDRREARELDDIAGQAWSRRRDAEVRARRTSTGRLRSPQDRGYTR